MTDSSELYSIESTMVGGGRGGYSSVLYKMPFHLVTMEKWDLKHRLFVYGRFMRSSESIKATKRLLSPLLNVVRQGAVVAVTQSTDR